MEEKKDKPEEKKDKIEEKKPKLEEKLEDQERYQTVYAKERGSAAAPTAGMPRERTTEATMLTPLTTRSVVIALTPSCIPMNQPLKAMSERVAGAAQILMRK